MAWWLVWLIFVAAFVLLGFVGYHFSVRTLRFFTAAFVAIVIVFVTRYGVTHSGGGPTSFVNSFIRGFNHLSTVFFQPLLGRDVQAPGRIGWLFIVVALAFGYRELEVWAMRWQPPTVDTSALVSHRQDKQTSGASDAPDQSDDAVSGPHARLMSELRFRLPAVAVRAPAILPGGTRPSELASIAETSGVAGSGLAGAVIRFVGILWPNPRRYRVRVWVEDGTRPAQENSREHAQPPADRQQGTPGSTRVTVDLENFRTGASIVAYTLVAPDIDQAASVAAGYVGRQVFKQDPTTSPWCVGSFAGEDLAGMLLAAQQRVSPESPSDIRRSRRQQIGILQRCRLDAGVARYELAELYDLEGHHARALRLHTINRADYPRFYRGRYRLGMSLEMIANPAFRLPDEDVAEMRDSLAVLDRCHRTNDAVRKFDWFFVRDKLPPELREELLTAAAEELRAVRRQLTLRWVLWEMFVHRDERMIRKQYWRLGQRERFHDGARVAELLVAVRRSLLDEELHRSPRPNRLDHHAKRAMNIVAAVAGDCAEIGPLLDPAPKRRAREPRPGRKPTKTRWLYWQCRSPSWQAAYNAACLYAALAQRPGHDQDKDEMSRHVVASLRRAVDDDECEMERPWDWMSTDPDFRILKWSSKEFMSFRHAQLDRDYPAQKKICPFCRGRAEDIKITPEYLFTDWASELPAPAVAGPVVRCERAIPEETASAWPVAEVAGHSRRAVCEPCDRGWMASLEGAARPFLTPMIKGSEARLTTEDQITVAAWAVLKAAVFEHVWTHDPILTSADCEIIMTRHRPPADVQVRLGWAEPDNGPLRAYGRVFEPDGRGDKAVSVTITIGCLVVQVFGGPGAGPHAVRTVGQRGTDFIGIFPPQPGAVRWPPSALDEILLA